MALHRVYTTLLALSLAVALIHVLKFRPNSVVVQGKAVARASHILVETKEECDDIFQELQAAHDLEASFAQLARARSKCPSSRKGGELGSFGRGQMVSEFDKVAFEEPVGVVHKVKTQECILQFGWHLVLVTDRTGMETDVNVVDDEKAPDRDL
ncbi:hypothetical protein PsorP6_009772 [Peronosclerospora sorghi]|uniref:Uncharacterized protein n=1 Tax=Peronosclerospora sorghi TaxID=230839 RepID=A0ACC0W250_9STRA|nr:hypothetical protein PsorP6_009772 [Peronosclerospora sorghi]